MNVTDEQIKASVKEAETMLTSLDLTEEEKQWAKKQSKIIFHMLTEAFIEERDMTANSGPKIVPAAVAYALVLSRDWSENLKHVFKKIASEKK